MADRLEKLNVYQARQLAIEAGYRVLPIWSRDFPKDKTIRQCLEVTEAFLQGSANAADLAHVREAAEETVYAVPTGKRFLAAQQAGYAAVAAADKNPHKGANKALTRALLATKYAPITEAIWQNTRISELADAEIISDDQQADIDTYAPEPISITSESTFTPPPGMQAH